MFTVYIVFYVDCKIFRLIFIFYEVYLDCISVLYLVIRKCRIIAIKFVACIGLCRDIICSYFCCVCVYPYCLCDGFIIICLMFTVYIVFYVDCEILCLRFIYLENSCIGCAFGYFVRYCRLPTYELISFVCHRCRYNYCAFCVFIFCNSCAHQFMGIISRTVKCTPVRIFYRKVYVEPFVCFFFEDCCIGFVFSNSYRVFCIVKYNFCAGFINPFFKFITCISFYFRRFHLAVERQYLFYFIFKSIVYFKAAVYRIINNKLNCMVLSKNYKV